MNLELQKSKKFGIKKQIRAFKFCFSGIIYTIKNEQSFVIELIIGFIAIILGLILKLNIIEWCIVCIVIGLVLSLELINTAVEAVVDLVTKDKKELAKIAKDTSAGAVLVMAIVSVIIGIIIYLPKIISLF